MADGKITVTLKADKGFDAPWVVLSADTAGEMRDRLGEVDQSGLLADVGRLAAAFKGYAAMGATVGARPVAAPSQSGPTTAPSEPAADRNSGWGSPAPAQPQNAPQSAPANEPKKLQPQHQPDGSILVKDGYGNEWEYNVQGNVPQTPRGPAIVKRGTTKSGKFKGQMWRKWMDPAAGPKWREDGMERIPAADRWQGEFIK